MRKSKLALKILEIVEEAALTTATLMEAFLTSPYGSSYSRLQRRAEEIENERERRASAAREKKQFYDLIYNLKKDGLIKKGAGGRRGVWLQTAKGRRQKKILKDYHAHSLPHKEYKKTIDGELKIIAFDIPEKYHRRRDWLRSALMTIGFTMLQKSVWIGKAEIPEELINDLRDLAILQYVEILAVTKTGSLRKIANA